jgi:hypothetical protein
MQSGITVGSVIEVKHGGTVALGKVRRIGAVARDPRTMFAWAMLTLDVRGDCVYAAAREDELASP